MNCDLRRNDGVQWIFAATTMTVLMVNGMHHNDGVSLNCSLHTMAILVDNGGRPS